MKNPVGFLFIVFLFLVSIGSGWSFESCPGHERRALLDFKNAAVDPSHRLSSWEGEDCCKWLGVGCDNETGHVVKLDLRNPFPYHPASLPNRVTTDFYIYPGHDEDKVEYAKCLTVLEVNSSFLNLQHLNHLDLSWNYFSGMSIPSFFGSFPKLRYLNLSSSRFSGIVPPHLGNLSSLVSLDLHTHFIDDDYIPSLDSFHWLSSLTSLQYLDMSQIKMAYNIDTTASLPYTLLELRLCKFSVKFSAFQLLQNLTSLLVLDLSGNYFDGRIPNAISNMTLLESLDLSDNDFHNCNQTSLDEFRNLRNIVELRMARSIFTCRFNLPNSLFHLKRIKSLDLSDNSFYGPIPESFGNLTMLEELDLTFNKLSGKIPISLGALSNMTSLWLGHNQLNGNVPESLGQLSKLVHLVLSRNSLVGVLSKVHFAKLFELKHLDLSDNFLSLNITPDWIAPFQLIVLGLRNCKVGSQFPPWIQTQTNINYLLMSTSGISDSVPIWFRNSRYPNLYYLLLSSNHIPEIASVFFNSNSSLAFLDLSNCSINTPIPDNIGHILPNLKRIFLYDNQITGSIPKSLCKMKSLDAIIISNNNLSGYLLHCWSDLPHLENMDFSFNRLYGKVPASIGTLQSLRSLRLSKNDFHGELPSTFRHCTDLAVLDLRDNKLSGEFPDWIGRDVNYLHVVQLRSNNFSGNLSSNLCHLSQLRILDVAHNNLSGSIPHCFGDFTQMASNLQNPNDELYLNGYNERLDLVTKGREDEYTKIVSLVVLLDLSSNSLTGKIPAELTKLYGLQGLNLSSNLLTGRIPQNIGEMQSLESLDFSMNRLSGEIPESISSLLCLSHLNLSFNHLSGKIPSGHQLQSLSDPATIYMGNTELCGAPLPKNCSRDDPPQAPTKVMNNREEDELNMTFFYIGLSCGLVVGFWGFCAVLFFQKTWRAAYFRFINDTAQGVYDQLYVAIVVRVNRKFRAQ